MLRVETASATQLCRRGVCSVQRARASRVAHRLRRHLAAALTRAAIFCRAGDGRRGSSFRDDRRRAAGLRRSLPSPRTREGKKSPPVASPSPGGARSSPASRAAQVALRWPRRLHLPRLSLLRKRRSAAALLAALNRANAGHAADMERSVARVAWLGPATRSRGRRCCSPTQSQRRRRKAPCRLHVPSAAATRGAGSFRPPSRAAARSYRVGRAGREAILRSGGPRGHAVEEWRP